MAPPLAPRSSRAVAAGGAVLPRRRGLQLPACDAAHWRMRPPAASRPCPPKGAGGGIPIRRGRRGGPVSAAPPLPAAAAAQAWCCSRRSAALFMVALPVTFLSSLVPGGAAGRHDRKRPLP